MLKKILPAIMITCLCSTVAEARYYEYEREEPQYHRRYEQYQRPEQHYQMIEHDTVENSGEFKPRAYIGTDFSYAEADYKSDYWEIYPEKGYETLSLNVGFRLHKNFGIEGFYEKSSEEDKSEKEYWGYDGFSADVTTSFQAFGLDFIGYLPLSEEVELLAALGLGEYKVKADSNVSAGTYFVTEHEKDDKLVTRFSLGMLYNISENFALRTMFRYIPVKNDYLKNITEISTGIRYTF